MINPIPPVMDRIPRTPQPLDNFGRFGRTTVEGRPRDFREFGNTLERLPQQDIVEALMMRKANILAERDARIPGGYQRPPVAPPTPRINNEPAIINPIPLGRNSSIANALINRNQPGSGRTNGPAF